MIQKKGITGNESIMSDIFDQHIALVVRGLPSTWHVQREGSCHRFIDRDVGAIVLPSFSIFHPRI